MPPTEPTRRTSPPRPLLMGIVNVTPDSFSGDGRLGAEAVRSADQLVADGADWLDVGAESTRPQPRAVVPLGPDAEWQRLQPVLQALAGRPWRQRIRLGVDTRHAATARRALAAGADLINDVGGLTDPAMQDLLAAAPHDPDRGQDRTCDVVVMHALSVPVDPALTLAADADVLQVLLQWKDDTERRAAAAGIAPQRLILDPGIGFGKTAAQSLQLVQQAAVLVDSGGRWLYGHSRKSFLKLFTDAEAAARDDLTLALSAQLAAAGVQVLRVHAVQRHARLFERL